MNKRRVTLNLDADVVEALKAVGGDSMSAVANEALREALESAAHRAALLEWMDELNEKYGAPTQEQLDEADAFLDALERGELDSRGRPVTDTHDAA
jgi:Arc/MetJ-type ribon-helix-helix transcriptional regulator